MKTEQEILTDYNQAYTVNKRRIAEAWDAPVSQVDTYIDNRVDPFNIKPPMELIRLKYAESLTLLLQIEKEA